MKSMQSTTTTH